MHDNIAIDQSPSFTLVCVPYLATLRAPCCIGPWLIMSSKEYREPWPRDDIQAKTADLLGRFLSHRNQPIDDPAIIIDAAHGIIGEPPTQGQLRALQLALDFGVLNHNRDRPVEDMTWSMVTADNSQIQEWQIPLGSDNFIVYQTGSIIKTTHHGWELMRGDWTVPYPLELKMPDISIGIDDDTAKAIYELDQTVFDDLSIKLEQQRTLDAIRWWSKSWRNTASITMDDRIVFMKTAFETLLGKSGNIDCARRLRRLFEAVDTTADECSDLLWSPSEIAVHERIYKKKGEDLKCTLTDLELWFVSFGEQRNLIVHEGKGSGISTVVPEQYQGDFFMVAERVFRESIRMKLESFGFSGLWKSAMDRRIDRALARDRKP